MLSNFCGRKQEKADARWDGDPTTVGYQPCPCSKWDWERGAWVPKSEEDLEREALLAGADR
jgi:hypothetical protein